MAEAERRPGLIVISEEKAAERRARGVGPTDDQLIEYFVAVGREDLIPPHLAHRKPRPDPREPDS